MTSARDLLHHARTLGLALGISAALGCAPGDDAIGGTAAQDGTASLGATSQALGSATNRFYATADDGPVAARPWAVTRATRPSRLFGANGLAFHGGKLHVAQTWGSQISALDLGAGTIATLSPMGGAIVSPDDLAFDSAGNLYVTEVMNGRVVRRTPQGDVEVVASGLTTPNGIAVAGERIFVSECNPTGRILEIYADGTAPRVIAAGVILPNALAVRGDDIYFPMVATGEVKKVPIAGGVPELVLDGLAMPVAVRFRSPDVLVVASAASGQFLQYDVVTGTQQVIATVDRGIDNFTFDAAGQLYYSNFLDGRIAVLGPSGQEQRLVPAGLLGGWGLSVAADGTTYVADGASLAVVGPARSFTRVGWFALGGYPGFTRGVQVAAAGGVYLTTTDGKLSWFDPASQAGAPIAQGLADPHDVVELASGALLVAETGLGRVLSVDPAGGDVTVIASGLDRPTGLAVDGDGNVYVSESGAGRVRRVVGKPGFQLGAFVEPQGIAVVGATLFVLDAGARTLTAVSLEERQRSTIASNLPVGAPAGVKPVVLQGAPGLIPGPFLPFAGLRAAPDGRLFVSANGEGSVLVVAKD